MLNEINWFPHHGGALYFIAYIYLYRIPLIVLLFKYFCEKFFKQGISVSYEYQELYFYHFSMCMNLYYKYSPELIDQRYFFHAKLDKTG